MRPDTPRVTLLRALTATLSRARAQQAVRAARTSGVRVWAAQAECIAAVLARLPMDPRDGDDLRVAVAGGRAIVRWRDEMHYGATVLDALAQLAQCHCDLL
jgi:hypothetical protein